MNEGTSRRSTAASLCCCGRPRSGAEQARELLTPSSCAQRVGGTHTATHRAQKRHVAQYPGYVYFILVMARRGARPGAVRRKRAQGTPVLYIFFALFDVSCGDVSNADAGPGAAAGSSGVRDPVRFYILDGPHWRRWRKACANTSPRVEAVRPDNSGASYEQWTEGLFLQQLRTHHWRTRRADEAEWIIVPAYPSFSVDGACDFKDAGLPARHDERMTLLAQELRSDALFSRQGGADFFLMGMDWRLDFVTFAPFLSDEQTKETLGRLAWGWLENRKLTWRMRGDNCEVAVPVLSAPLPAPSPLPLTARNRTLFFMGRAYVKRMHKWNPIVRAVGKAPHCCEGVKQDRMPVMGFYEARVLALRKDGLASAAAGPHVLTTTGGPLSVGTNLFKLTGSVARSCTDACPDLLEAASGLHGCTEKRKEARPPCVASSLKAYWDRLRRSAVSVVLPGASVGCAAHQISRGSS